MSLEGRTRLRLGAAARRLPRWLAVLFPFSILGTIFGQGFLVPPPVTPGASAVPTMGNVSGNTGPANSQNNGQSIGGMNGESAGEVSGQPNGNGQSGGQAGTEGGPSGTAAASTMAPVTSLMQWGAFHLHARANYQFLYATGIHPEPGKSADTFTHTITPGLDFDLGPHVRLSYSPSFRFYSDKDFHNTVNHFASLDAHLGYGDWTFSTLQTFSLTDDPMVETSGQTQQKNYSAALTATYQLNEKISLETAATVGMRWVNGTNVFIGPVTNLTSVHLGNSQDYSGSEWLNYRFNEKILTSAGVVVGYSTQDGGFRSTFEQYEGRIFWQPGEKLSASLTGGLDDRQFLNSGAPDDVSPIFSATVNYHLFERTMLSLSANRSVAGALFLKQITETTAVGVGLQQRLLGFMQLSLGFGYTTSDYKSTDAKLKTARTDDGTSYSAALTIPFRKHWNFGGFYEYSQNTSSAGGFGFSTSQVGATLSWVY